MPLTPTPFFFCSCFSLSPTPHLLLHPDSPHLHPSLPFYFQASPFIITEGFLVSNPSETGVLFSKMAINSCDKFSPPHVKRNSHMIVPREDLYISKDHQLDNAWNSRFSKQDLLALEETRQYSWECSGLQDECGPSSWNISFSQRFQGRLNMLWKGWKFLAIFRIKHKPPKHSPPKGSHWIWPAHGGHGEKAGLSQCFSEDCAKDGNFWTSEDKYFRTSQTYDTRINHASLAHPDIIHHKPMPEKTVPCLAAFPGFGAWCIKCLSDDVNASTTSLL